VAQVIGAAHAGWRGAVDGVLEATIDAMESLGAQRSQITAVIGPTISQAAYEVGPEFFDRFRAEDEASTRFFANGKGDRMLFDLPGYGLHRLRRPGWARPNGPAIAPIATPPGSIPSAVPPTRPRQTMGG
jgi:copper oxidase (laccase) domain-containing protein